jgi:CRISPR-associated protein Cmr2
MRFDHFAELAQQKACPTQAGSASSLASGFVDGCTVWSCKPKAAPDSPMGAEQMHKKSSAPTDEARRCYTEGVAGLATASLPAELCLDTRIDGLPDPAWIALEVEFKLETPWYSKDDRAFHVLDNPVRKDRVFGVPFMSAASWKGLLRWSCRMLAGLYTYRETHAGDRDRWSDPDWVLHLFGNERGEGERFHRGALAFYPTWFSGLGFEVINPQSRARRAGTQPIYYEVVPAGTPGVLRLLYAPLPEGTMRHKVDATDSIAKLIDSIEALLTTYGISAKRTVGWGTAIIRGWTAQRKDEQLITETSSAAFKSALKP